MTRTATITPALSLICCLLLTTLALAAPITNPDSSITVTNYVDGETIRYPVALIRGTLADTKAESVTVVNISSDRPNARIDALARNGRFKALAELIPGPNRILIRQGEQELNLTITYKPQTNPRIVRVIYLTDNTDATDYQSPLDDDPQDHAEKLGTAMKIMQTFTAESLHDQGLDRLTFNLEFDEDGKVIVHRLNTEKSVEELYELTGLQLWQFTGRLIRRKLPDRNAKNLAIPAFTRFDPETKKTNAHTALGGGNLALFGGANIFAWPSNIAEAQNAFTDATVIDTNKFLSDSVFRNTYWATASTTIGAALHELGHTFDLPHSNHPHDIMTRGFDRFNRAFTLVEPPHARRRRPTYFNDDEIACWTGPSSAWLQHSRWLALDDIQFSDDNKTQITLAGDPRQITVQSDNGIGAVVLTAKGDAKENIPLGQSDKPHKHLTFAVADYEKTLSADDAKIRVLDIQGLSKTVDMADLIGSGE